MVSGGSTALLGGGDEVSYGLYSGWRRYGVVLGMEESCMLSFPS
jgi:hypothetical protein